MIAISGDSCNLSKTVWFFSTSLWRKFAYCNSLVICEYTSFSGVTWATPYFTSLSKSSWLYLPSIQFWTASSWDNQLLIFSVKSASVVCSTPFSHNDQAPKKVSRLPEVHTPLRSTLTLLQPCSSCNIRETVSSTLSSLAESPRTTVMDSVGWLLFSSSMSNITLLDFSLRSFPSSVACSLPVSVSLPSDHFCQCLLISQVDSVVINLHINKSMHNICLIYTKSSFYIVYQLLLFSNNSLLSINFQKITVPEWSCCISNSNNTRYSQLSGYDRNMCCDPAILCNYRGCSTHNRNKVRTRVHGNKNISLFKFMKVFWSQNYFCFSNSKSCTRNSSFIHKLLGSRTFLRKQICFPEFSCVFSK